MENTDSSSKPQDYHYCDYWEKPGNSTQAPFTGNSLGIHNGNPVPFASTPKSKNPVPLPSLSVSLASLSVDDLHVVDSFYGDDGDRSRSIIGANEYPGPSSSSSKLLEGPLCREKLRDRPSRKILARSSSERVFSRRAFSTLRSEAAQICAPSRLQSANNEAIRVQHMKENMLPHDNDVITLDEDSGEGCSNIAHISTSLSEKEEPEVITISSSSEDLIESDGNVGRLMPCPIIKEALPSNVKITSKPTKYAGKTSTELKARLESLQKLLKRVASLPDAGERIFKQIEDIQHELDGRKGSVETQDDIAHSTGKIILEKRDGKKILCSMPRSQRPMIDAHRENPRSIQEEALAELHKALITQPGPKQLTNTPDGLLYPLKEHQMSGLTWLIWRESLSPYGGILADEMGLGKTLLMIALIVTAKAKSKVEQARQIEVRQLMANQQGLTPSNATLVIAPAALIYHWESEVNQKCKSGLLRIAVYHSNRKSVSCEMLAKKDIVITTYTLAANELHDASQASSPLARIYWARIILDEAHNIKNRRTKTAKAVCGLTADARWCVTGTPVHNNLWDLYSLIKFLKVEYFSDEHFWKEYVLTATTKSTERLNLLMKNYVLRREKNFLSPLTEMLLVDLPTKYSHDHMVQFSEEERLTYSLIYESSRAKVKELITEDEEMERRFGGNIKKSNSKLLNAKNFILYSTGQSNITTKFRKIGCVLVMLLRLRQACIHFHLTKNAVDMEAFQSLGAADPLTAKEQEDLANITIDNYVDPMQVKNLCDVFQRGFVSAKISIALELLSRILKDNEKCVIVSQWTSFLKILEEHVVARLPDAKCSSITGDVLPSERQRRVDDFNRSRKGTNVMLISITAGGVGLNLTGGNHLILMDLHWNPALELQARDRIHRMGQTREVHIHKLVIKESIEERVLALQTKKMELATNVLQGAVSKKNMNLTMADLRFLFDLDSRR